MSLFLFLILFILTIFYSSSKKYRSNANLLLFSFLQGFLLSFIYADIFHIHLLNSIIYIPLFSGIYFILFKQLPYILIALKSKKLEEYTDKSLIKWINSINVLKNREFSIKKFGGEHSLTAFVLKIPFSKIIRITFGQKLIDKLNEKERIVVVAHEVGHQLKRHFLIRYLAFSVSVVLITFLFSYIRDLTLLNFNLSLELRMVLFFCFAFLFFILTVVIFNSISFIIEYNADKQALLLTGDYKNFERLMLKFEKWKPTKNYGKIINLIIYDHPLISDRINKAKNYQK